MGISHFTSAFKMLDISYLLLRLSDFTNFYITSSNFYSSNIGKCSCNMYWEVIARANRLILVAVVAFLSGTIPSVTSV